MPEPGGKVCVGQLVMAPLAAGVVASPDPVVRVPRRVGALKWVYNGKEVDQGIARKAQQEPEGEMEGTETAAAAEAP